MKYLFILLSVFYIGHTAQAQQDYWQQELRYIIDVTLDDKDHELDGFLKLNYINHSPDTLLYIWFHLWPNAYRNDKTAFSEQLLENGRTDFYFSSRAQKGYINRLDFRINNTTLKTEDHPEFIDIVKVFLTTPLPPEDSTIISTPFHIKLPYQFSRSGYIDQRYAITQWYPKPAVYDRKGWHPMPYLDQGEFYGEFGSYDVRITLPENYIVAATGELQNAGEKKWLQTRANSSKERFELQTPEILLEMKGVKKEEKQVSDVSESSLQTKTIRYIQSRVHDFAWFADKEFIVNHDTLALPGGRMIDVYAYYRATDADVWKEAVAHTKDAILFRSAAIGEYPYNIVSVVAGPAISSGGMEYPTITLISGITSSRMLDFIIEHEVGHNWFQGILASNERKHPWMDEGMNTYYDQRYLEQKYGNSSLGIFANGEDQGRMRSRLPRDEMGLLVYWITAIHKDQPMSTGSQDFTNMNFNIVAYAKAGGWMAQLENILGRETFDSSMKMYFRNWKFRHPYPEDFKMLMESTSGRDLSEHFDKLDKTGPLIDKAIRKKIKPAFLFNFNGTDSISYINFLPAIGFNQYDKLMIGMVVHNYNIPPEKFRFAIAPFYATGSRKINGIGSVNYNWFPSSGRFQKITAEISGSGFSSRQGLDSNGTSIYGGFSKIVPSLRLILKNNTARSTVEKWIEWKTFLIREQGFDYTMKSTDSFFYPVEGRTNSRYINQLSFGVNDNRALYPYDVQLQLQQGMQFYRAGITAQYFFNYANGGGMNIRFFAAKFGYINGRTDLKEFETESFQPKLTAVRGYEDYTYSNYFIGRNESDGFASQQIMMRDGGLKLRTDLFQGLQGRSDNWVSSININTSLPEKLFPFKLPLRLFLDVGTYAEAWQKESPTGRFLYVGGLQLSLFKELLNVYAPIFYSKEFRDNLKSVPEENKFFRRLSFSIDIHRLSLRKIAGNQIPL